RLRAARDEHSRRAFAREGGQPLAQRGRDLDRLLLEERARAEEDALALLGAGGDARAPSLLVLGQVRQLQSCSTLRDRPGERVRRALRRRGREREDLVAALDGDDLRAAARERAGLVEDDGGRARERLEHGHLLDEDPAPEPDRARDEERRRRREPER